jgi:phosphoglycerate dehydrogenase-like enzyme
MVAPARAFGMRVTGWSRNLDPARATALGVAAPGREEFFATADVLSVHVKLGPRSVGYVGAAELALLRPTALLVNTSRGPVVDTAALVAALRAGRLAGAALDVYDTEPLPAGHVLRDLPGVVLSPHAGYVTEDSYREYFPQLVEDVAAFLDGRPVRVLA